MPHLIDLSSFSLDRVAIDYSVELLFQNADRWVLVRFTEGCLEDGLTVDAALPQSIPALLELLHIAANHIRIGDDGRLDLAFEGGVAMHIIMDTHYEAWEIVTSDQRRWVCMPGGETAVWN